MTARFAASALRLCGLAAQGLGWRPAEFWSATPGELAAALAPPAIPADTGLTRADLDRLLEHDHG